MTRTFDRWMEIETASDFDLARELQENLVDLAYDLRVCGATYPSPRYQTVRDLIREQERRKQPNNVRMTR